MLLFVSSFFVSAAIYCMAKNIPIPFKHGWAMKGEDIRRFERKAGISVPADVIHVYGAWNGGSIDGWLVFDVPQCEKLAVSKFLSFRNSPDGHDPAGDFVVTELTTNTYLSTQTFEKLDVVPIAVVGGSISTKEQKNTLNCRSVLVFKRESGASIFLLSGSDGRMIKVADSLTGLLERAVFWFQFLEPGKSESQ